MTARFALPAAAALVALLTACSKPQETAKAPPPAKTDAIAHETELLRITLTPDAERRLGITTASVAGADDRTWRTYPAEVVLPAQPGGLPVATTTELATLGTAQARAEGELARAEADLRLARANLQRATNLVAEEAGSLRQRDEARAAVGAAEAAAAAARRQRQLLGPAVSNAGRSGLWVRANLFAGDLATLATDTTARVRLASAQTNSFAVRPVQGPPTANAAAGTVDVYFALPPGTGFRPGQRLALDLPERSGTKATGLTVPASAVLVDIHGGEWVYAALGDHVYERRRVAVARSDGGRAVLAQGLEAGTRVVTAGAAELFGTEFGTK